MSISSADLQFIIDLSCRAGDLINQIRKDKIDWKLKEDNTPVTTADLAANACLVSGLKQRFSTIPIISEESTIPPFEERRLWKEVWILDPLDGTKAFINNEETFTVNIALVRLGRPILGVIHCPSSGVTYYGSEGDGAFKRSRDGELQPLPMVLLPSDHTIRVLQSHAHVSKAEQFFCRTLESQGHKVERLSCSSSIKFCWMAEGRADLYFRYGRLSEWDVAAGDAIATAAGCFMGSYPEGMPLVYNQRSTFSVGPFLVRGSACQITV